MEDLVQLSYSVDTFYFLVMGVLVMFMAPGFAMLEAGMVQSKNTSEILTKNVALFAIASVMYLLVGYAIMYGGGGMLIGSENTVDDVLASGGDVYYSARSDFFSSGLRSDSYVHHLWCSRRKNEVVVIPAVCSLHDRRYLPIPKAGWGGGGWFDGS